MDTTQHCLYDWHSFPHISVNLSKSFGASVLQIIDYIEGVVLINDHAYYPRSENRINVIVKPTIKPVPLHHAEEFFLTG